MPYNKILIELYIIIKQKDTEQKKKIILIFSGWKQ